MSPQVSLTKGLGDVPAERLKKDFRDNQTHWWVALSTQQGLSAQENTWEKIQIVIFRDCLLAP